MEWNREQKRSIELATSGKSIFIGGKAGTGKSEVTIHIIKTLQENGKNVGIMAPSHPAANRVGGQTIHKFLGIMVPESETPHHFFKELAKQYMSKTQIFVQNLKYLHCIIIEEIGMVSPFLFSFIDAACRIAKKKDLPFGGIQLIVVGDFMQLPTVNGEFCYITQNWADAIGRNVVVLTQVVRQSELSLQRMLNSCRIGKPDAEDFKIMKERQLAYHKAIAENSLPIDTYHICPTNKLVNQINQTFLENLPGLSYTFPVTINRADPTKRKPFIEAESIKLKVGAVVSVSFGKNQGRRGIIVSFRNDFSKLAPVVSFFDNKDEETICPVIFPPNCSQCEKVGECGQCKYLKKRGRPPKLACNQLVFTPLKLDWAATVHKVQSKTIPNIAVSIDNNHFLVNQVYVILSRVPKLAGLWIKGSKIDLSVIKSRERDVLLEQKWIQMSLCNVAAAA